jgi:MFS family permease
MIESPPVPHTTSPTTSTATRHRTAVLAVFPVAAAALLMLGGALTPHGLDKPITTITTALREIPIAHAHANRLYASNMLVLFGLGALGVTFAAIATLAREQDALLATIAALFGGLGAFCGALVNMLVGYNLAAAATANTTPIAAAKVLVSANTSIAAVMLFAGYLGSLLIATVLAGIALWRSQTVPRWLAILFTVGLLIGATAPPGIINVVLSIPFAIAMVLLATRIHGANNTPAEQTLNPQP